MRKHAESQHRYWRVVRAIASALGISQRDARTVYRERNETLRRCKKAEDESYWLAHMGSKRWKPAQVMDPAAFKKAQAIRRAVEAVAKGKKR